MKKKIILLSVILLLLFLLCYPAEALAAARNGLKLWLETLLPTLLPFMILTGILVHTDWITKILQPTAPFFKVVWAFSRRSLCISSGTSHWLPYGGKINRRFVLCWKNQPAGG